MTDIVMKIDNLTHVYGSGTPFERAAVENISLEIIRGEFLGIIGRTGSGKSTLIQHLNGLLKPAGGKVYLDGKDIWGNEINIRDVRFRVGLVFQYPEYQLFEDTVAKDIAFGPKNMKLSDSEVEERVQEAARLVGIDADTLARSPFDLSGGQKRRAAIAGVMAMRPDVLILDEPTAGLDPRGRREILDRIAAYHRETGATVVLVTHSMEDIARYATRIAVLDGEGVRLCGEPAEVFKNAEILEEIGLDIPQITKVMLRLKELGVDADPSVLTVEQAAQSLLSLKGGAADA